MEKYESSKSDVPARAYLLTAEDLKIKLWYASNNEWLALQSSTPSGSVLHYVRTDDSVSNPVGGGES